MKRRAVIKRIEDGARRAGVLWTLDSEGSKHTIYMLAGKKIPVPRHTEIDEKLVEKIFKECGEILGERWWR